MSKDPKKTVTGINDREAWGISPFGGNSVEGTGDGMAAVRDTAVQGVPLFYDSRVDNFISEQAIEELDDREASLIQAEQFNEEEEFRTKAGYRRL